MRCYQTQQKKNAHTTCRHANLYASFLRNHSQASSPSHPIKTDQFEWQKLFLCLLMITELCKRAMKELNGKKIKISHVLCCGNSCLLFAIPQIHSGSLCFLFDTRPLVKKKTLHQNKGATGLVINSTTAGFSAILEKNCTQCLSAKLQCSSYRSRFVFE